MLAAVILFIKRMAQESRVSGWKYYDEENPDSSEEELRNLPKYVRVYEISGPMFFGTADHIADIHLKDFTKVLIIRMRGVPALDSTAMKALEELYAMCTAKGVRLIFSHVNEQPMKTMEKAGFVEKVGAENFAAHIEDAIALASVAE